MSNFVMIAPNGYMLLDSYYLNSTDLNTGTMVNASHTTIVEIATTLMLERGDMTPEQTIDDIQLINDELWVKLV